MSDNSPCFLNEADNKFSDFDGLVSLKGDHLLQGWTEFQSKVLVYYQVHIIRNKYSL